MNVVRSGEAPVEEMTGGIFTGTVNMTPLINKDTGAAQLRAALVYFPPGVRNHFHSHTHEQILYVTKGRGIVATREREQVVEPGDIIVFPAGEEHWHGAVEDTGFEHLYVVGIDSKTSY